MFVYNIDLENKIKFQGSLNAEGNVIDVAVLHRQKAILYTMDNAYRPLLKTAVSDGGIEPALGVYKYITESGAWSQVADLQETVSTINRWSAMQGDASQTLNKDFDPGELLYSIENLRKRGQEEQTER